MSNYVNPYYYHYAYWNQTPYDNRNYYAVPYNFSASQYNSYPYIYSNLTNESFRQDSNNCHYVGTISPDGKTASGTYKCDNGLSGKWSGTIVQDDKHEDEPEVKDEAASISKEMGIWGDKAKVRCSLHPDLNQIQIEGFILGKRIINQTVTLAGTTEIVDKKTVAGHTVKFVYGIQPDKRLIYVRAEFRIGGRRVGELPVTPLIRW